MPLSMNDLLQLTNVAYEADTLSMWDSYIPCNYHLQSAFSTLTAVKGYIRLQTTLAFDRSHIKTKSDNMNTTSRWHDAGQKGAM